MAKRIGLFFGTFNPIHIGHLAIANHMAQFGPVDKVWMVVTPHNPHKKKSSLLADHQRLTMVRIAVEDYPLLEASKIEFDLPQPNYTVNTLAHLEERYPELEFALIMGADNLQSLHKWKNYEVLLERYPLLVYPRLQNGVLCDASIQKGQIERVQAPIMEISSTFIRKSIKARKDIRPLLPAPVWTYLDEMHFYRS